MNDITIEQQIACVKREIEMRRIVYERRVAEHKMDAKKAAKEITEMNAVLATLLKVQAEQRPQLFT